MKKFTININKKITERDFMEHCLNLKCSGYDPTFLVAFYSLGKRWKVDKLIYLLNLLEDLKGMKTTTK